MRILVVSDSHGRWSRISQAVLSQSSAELVIHLGDGASDLENVRYEFPEKMMIGVAGNCDFMSDLDRFSTFTVEGKKIFYTHGHLFGVKGGYEHVLNAARQNEADICLFGHTHIPVEGYYDGIHLMNPGSLGEPRNGIPTYGIIDIVKGGIVTNIVEMKNA